MYIDTYLVIPLWVFAIFGIFYFFINVYDTWDTYRHKKARAQTLIITAKNQEDEIEGLVRSYIFKAGLSTKEEKLLQIILLDMGSADDTYRIMEILSRNYQAVKLVKPKAQ